MSPSAMLALISITSYPVRLSTWQLATRSLSCLNRLRQAPIRSAEEVERLTRRRKRYLNDPVFRQKTLNASRNAHRNPEITMKRKASWRAKNKRHSEKYVEINSLAWANNLDIRRAMTLSKLLSKEAVARYTWITHAPTQYTERVVHCCTSCNRNRLLRRWWQEKPEAPECSGQLNSDRYMCNHCFANDWPRVVPETYEGCLYDIFRSPEFPLYKGRHQESNGGEEQKSQKK